jgi:hypothetical protein
MVDEDEELWEQVEDLSPILMHDTPEWLRPFLSDISAPSPRQRPPHSMLNFISNLVLSCLLT